MLSVDTNLLFYALNDEMREHEQARQLLQEWKGLTDMVISELVLAELYQLLRSPRYFQRPFQAEQAVEIIQRFQRNPKWILVENAPVMKRVWTKAKENNFARRRLFDVRLAYTLQHHGVKRFATANVKDFVDLGFEKVWNPLLE